MSNDRLSCAEAASLLGISDSRVRALIREDRIKAHRVGKRSWVIRERDVRAFVDGRKIHLPKDSDPPRGRPKQRECLCTECGNPVVAADGVVCLRPGGFRPLHFECADKKVHPTEGKAIRLSMDSPSNG
jgi:excisionase family DNA binding protein